MARILAATLAAFRCQSISWSSTGGITIPTRRGELDGTSLRTVERDRNFELRSSNNTYHLLNVFVASALALAPQPALFFGVEVALISLYALRLPIGVTRHFYHQDKAIREGKRFPAGIIVTIVTIYALGIAGGAALIAGSSWGFPMVAASCVLLVVRAVLTAWGLMFSLRPVATTAKLE